MVNKKKNLYAVSAEHLVFGIDYELVTSTKFDEDKVKYFVKILNHEIDTELAYDLGLGIVSNLHEMEDFYLYSASYDKDENFSYLKELLRFEIYYLLTHLTYENKKFEDFICSGLGILFLKQMFDDAEEIYERLLKRFRINKGNVLPFDKKS